MNIKPKALATFIIGIALAGLAGCSATSGSQALPTLMPVAEILPEPTSTPTAAEPTKTPIPTLTPRPQYAVNDREFRRMAERIYDEWDRILEEDRRLTDLFVADFNYHLDAEYCNDDVNCKFEALNSAFEVKKSHLQSLSVLHSDLIKANQELRDISRRDVSPEAEPALVSMRNAADSFEKFYSYTFLAFGEEAGSAAQDRLFDQAVDAYGEGIEHYNLAWEILTGQAKPAEIEQVLNQPESLEFIGSGNRISEFTLSQASGVQVKGTHRGDSNFIGQIFNASGELEAIVFNCIGWCSDASITRLGPGTHYLEITADGDWEATVELTQ